MPAEVKRGLLEGNLLSTPGIWDVLPKQTRPPFPLPPHAGRKPLVKTAPKTSDKRPIVYGIFHVDGKGLPPPPSAYSQLLDALQLYKDSASEGLSAADHDAAQKIAAYVDGWKTWSKDKWLNSGECAAGRRRYLPRDSHVRELEQWMEQLRARITRAPKNEPLPWALCQVGYTFKQEERANHHHQHFSSVPLMNLVDAISHYLFDPHFTMRFVVLYEIFHERQAAPAEHIISHLGHAYTWVGGFNGSCGGQINSSIDRVEGWIFSLLELEAIKKPHFQAALAKEIADIPERAEQDEPLRERVRKLEEYARLLKEDAEPERQIVEGKKRKAELERTGQQEAPPRIGEVQARDEEVLERLRELDRVDTWLGEHVGDMERLSALQGDMLG
ncbi:hypothetical protein W97_01048 [Coniosporium apollinis CBS 100218]|uniref:Uncharacterized protein n=1 Tax=Coniosporium apollinis (strain CBS 100218) TaxID=1168221 RepID=R7YIU1_CONA1|nr:uncharacterized protein W97_01048 [Coniosporium apollinis CBS 100218]EON61830.1 hypothetical protein W97_01048 [Coniosporium apollinis CBS 100218]